MSRSVDTPESAAGAFEWPRAFRVLDADTIAVEDTLERAGYPLDWRGRTYRPVPLTWLCHGVVHDPFTDKSPPAIATSAALCPETTTVAVRYVVLGRRGPTDDVISETFTPTDGPHGTVPKPLAHGQWPAILDHITWQSPADVPRDGEIAYLRALRDAVQEVTDRV